MRIDTHVIVYLGEDPGWTGRIQDLDGDRVLVLPDLLEIDEWDPDHYWFPTSGVRELAR
jgi:hypothetical protein